MHRHFEDLGLAAGGGELQIALSAVDFPEQVRAARDPAAVVHREGGSALEQSADAHLIIRGPGLAFARSRDREGLSAHRHGGRELSDLAEAMAHGVRRVAQRDRKHRRAVFLVVEVSVERLLRRSPAHSRADHCGRQHVPNIPLFDQIMNIRNRRRGARLQPDHGKHAFFLCQRGQTLSFLQPVAQRPFAIDSLPRSECVSRQFEVIRHFHRDRDHIDGSTLDQIVVIVERQRHAKELARSGGRDAPTGGERRDFEIIRQGFQGRNVRLHSPATIRIGADDSYTNCM